MASYPFSEILVGDKFMFDGEGEGSIIKVKTGPSTYKITGESYVADGEAPESMEQQSEDLETDPDRPVVKLLNLIEMVDQIQHEIWEISVDGDETYSEVLDRVIENTSESEDKESLLVNKVATLIRDARNNGHDGIVAEPG